MQVKSDIGIYPNLCQHSQTYTQNCFESKDLLLSEK